MTTGWSQIITPYASVYSAGASIYPASYAAGASIYSSVWFIYENGQIVYTYPVNTVAPVVSGTARVGQTLSTTDGTWVGFGSITFTYLWIRNTGGAGTPITGATSSTYVVQAADYGYAVHCQVTGHNVYGNGVAQSSNSGVVVESVPVNTVAPAITGTTTVGQTLSCTTGTWTSVTTPTYTYQWKRSGSTIGGATSSTYVLVTADYANTMTCVVTATNTAGAGSPATSNTTAAVAEAVPVNTVAPVVSGYVYYGVQLSSTTGTWTSITTPTYTYQWQRNSSNISSATNSTYTCVEADEGQSITCNVTATNTNGGTLQASNALTSWIPSALSLSLWLDANHPSGVNSGTPVDGDAIGTLIDRAQSLSFTQGTSSNKPTWKTNILNGKPVFRFAGSSDQKLVESTTTLLSTGAAFTLVVVSQVSNYSTPSSNYRYLLCFKGSSGANSPTWAYSINASYKDVFFGASGGNWMVWKGQTVTTTNWQYVIVTYNGSGATTIGNYSASLNGVTSLTLSSASGNSGTTNNILGSYTSGATGNDAMNGDNAEVILFPSVVTGSNLTNLKTYLNQKYGL